MRAGLLSASLSRKAGGIYDAARNLACGLVSDGCEVRVFGLRDEFTDRDIPGWGGLSTQAFPILGPVSLGYAPRLRAALVQSSIELLHCHGLWMYPSYESLQWSRKTGRPYVISPHGMLEPWALGNSRWKKRLAKWFYEAEHLRGAACIHALCEAEADAIRAYGLTNPVCVIPSGVDSAMVGAADEEPAWAAAMPADARILLYLGRIHPKKGLRELIRGWHKARARQGAAEEWHLVIAGWDQRGHTEELHALVETLDIRASVHFVGPQFGRDKDLTYQRAAAFVLPSLSEGLPMVALEAWAHGLPVLMTRQCNLPEGFAARAAIEIAPDGDVISRELELLFSSSAQARAEIGSRGRRLVREKFNWPTIARQMLAVYRWVLGQAAKPDCVLTA